jgi:hypothetical protein
MVHPELGTIRTIIRFLVEFSVKSCVHLSLGSEFANWLFGISTSSANLPEYISLVSYAMALCGAAFTCVINDGHHREPWFS